MSELLFSVRRRGAYISVENDFGQALFYKIIQLVRVLLFTPVGRRINRQFG